LLKNKKYDSVKLMIQYIFPNQLGKILLFVTSYEKCNVSKRQLILKSVTLYVKIRKNYFLLLLPGTILATLFESSACLVPGCRK
jgi:hypothetical protein